MSRVVTVWVYRCPSDNRTRELRSQPKHPPRCTKCTGQMEFLDLVGGRR